jgi:hypothetical protein
MVRVIVENPTNIKVHFSWAKRAIINVQSLAKMSVGAKQEAYVKLMKALQAIVELGVIKVDTENAQTRESFPLRQDSGESILRQPSEVNSKHRINPINIHVQFILYSSFNIAGYFSSI